MNLKRNHVLYILLALSLMVALIVFMIPRSPKVSFMPEETSLTTAGSAAGTAATSTAFQYDVVTSSAQQERGLGGRSSIPSNYGMLFVFAQPTRVGFWMKDMRVAIDIIWLSNHGTILGIEDNISPDTYPKSFYPPQPVKYVLETRAGEARTKGWAVGTEVPLPPPYGLH